MIHKFPKNSACFSAKDNTICLNMWNTALSPLTHRDRRNGRHFADDIFKAIFQNGKFSILMKISRKFVPKGSLNNNPTLFQIMAWCVISYRPILFRSPVNVNTGILERRFCCRLCIFQCRYCGKRFVFTLAVFSEIIKLWFTWKCHCPNKKISSCIRAE